MREPFAFLTASVFSLLLFVASCGQPATESSDQARNSASEKPTVAGNQVAHEEEVKKLLNDMSGAVSTSDVVILGRMWADDFTFVVHDGEILNKSQLLDLIKSGTEKFESLTFDNIHVRTYGDTAVVTAKGTQKATLEGRDHSGTGTVSIVLVRGKDGWQIVLAQLAELRPVAKPAESNADPNANTNTRGRK